ncbi:hypothetical protein like AT2G34320 [Hibiscus trionum]|uniref:RNase H type-1 domain-containing protein n=1 Tax=Hibiscus trionum TaxID=183268 RepID=A0A9W7HM76_HIBTR|nr:hypothetical protein like AT2G34320 [Hibiscus trionum]
METSPLGFLKLNVDGALDLQRHKGGIGGLIRDTKGAVLSSFSEPYGEEPPTVVELMAIKHGIHFFLASTWSDKHRLIIESDCKTDVEWINGLTVAPPTLLHLVKDLSQIIKDKGIIVQFTYRGCNSEADRLARLGIG